MKQKKKSQIIMTVMYGMNVSIKPVKMLQEKSSLFNSDKRLLQTLFFNR